MREFTQDGYHVTYMMDGMIKNLEIQNSFGKVKIL